MTKTPNWDAINDIYRCKKLYHIVAVVVADFIRLQLFLSLYVLRRIAPDEVTYEAVARKEWAFIRQALDWNTRKWDSQLSTTDGAYYFEQYNQTSVSNLAYLAIWAPQDIRRYALYCIIFFHQWKHNNSR